MVGGATEKARCAKRILQVVLHSSQASRTGHGYKPHRHGCGAYSAVARSAYPPSHHTRRRRLTCRCVSERANTALTVATSSAEIFSRRRPAQTSFLLRKPVGGSPAPMLTRPSFPGLLENVRRHPQAGCHGVVERLFELVIGKPKGRAISMAFCDKLYSSCSELAAGASCSAALATIAEAASDSAPAAKVKWALIPTNATKKSRHTRGTGSLSRLPALAAAGICARIFSLSPMMAAGRGSVADLVLRAASASLLEIPKLASTAFRSL